jgi:glycosyltransferase involved in cell wall biosynthesis
MTMKADIIFLASDTLYEQKKALNDNVHLSPHGVDFDHFNRVLQNDTIIPDDISAIKKPVIGCFGLIDERIDLELIRHMAEKKADWHFIFIGRLDVDQNPCEGLANVHFIGRRPYAELPNYAALFDVTLMPYKPEHRMNINCNPLKLREYLSTGLPVVSARIPQAEKYTDVIQIEDSPQGFINAIDAAINEDKSLHIKSRLDRVREYTWDARVETVVSRVQDTIKQSSHRKNGEVTQA